MDFLFSRYFLVHLWTLSGLALSLGGVIALFHGNNDLAARLIFFPIVIDFTDGTLARRYRIKERIPLVSGEAIDMITDGVDHSGKSPEQVAIPEHMSVTFVITRPNPSHRRPTLDDVLAAAQAWDAVDGITVTTVSEYPGVWRVLGGG